MNYRNKTYLFYPWLDKYILVLFQLICFIIEIKSKVNL